MAYNYPTDLIATIESRWARGSWTRQTAAPALPRNHVGELLDVAFQASLLSEEGRPLQFRIAWCRAADLERDVHLRRRNAPVPFHTPRPFTVSELVRLAPATDPRQCLLGVHESADQKLEIWGIVDAGVSWWEFARGERAGSLGGSPPPDCFTVGSSQRGALVVSRAGRVICALERGAIVLPAGDVLTTGPFGKFIDAMARDFRADVLTAAQADRYDPSGQDETVPERMFVQFLNRVLDRVRDARHGGILLIVPDAWSLDDSRFRDRLRPKYPLDDNRTWPVLVESVKVHREYYDVLLPAYDKETVPRAQFHLIQSLGSHLEDVEDLVRDRAAFISSLAAVDGAVVLTTKLRLLAFGCEVVAASPALLQVSVAKDASATSTVPGHVDDYGTRHRSALRFCSSHEDVAAFVISQDGDVRATRRIGPDVVLWPSLEVSPFAL
jgi:hypothetical protein